MSYSKKPMNRNIGGPREDNPTEEQARDELEYDKGSDKDEEASDESGNHL